MIKNNKLILGITLIIQSALFLGVFAAIWAKKKSLIKTVLAVGLLGGAAGTLMTVQAIKKKNHFNSMKEAVDTLCKPKGAAKDIHIIVDDTASESDFE